MVSRTVKLNLSLSALSEPLRVVQQIRLNVPSLRREAPAAVLNLDLFSFLVPFLSDLLDAVFFSAWF